MGRVATTAANGRRSPKGWDVRTPDGEPIEVKAISKASARRVTCSAIRGRDYDASVVVVFDTNFQLVNGT